MPPEIVEAIAPLIATFAMLGGVLVGLRMYWNYKTRRLELERGGTPAHLTELVEDLRADVHALRGDVGEMQERLDFAERLLTRGQPDAGAGGRQS